MKQLAGLDAGFVHMEGPRTPFQVGTLLFYDVSTTKNKLVRFKDILATFESRVGSQSVLRKKLQTVPFNLDHPYWVDDLDFDIEYHVRHVALPKPGDWRQLCILVARMHARSLDMSRPLWEVYVIEGLDNVPGLPKGGFALYVKLHHAAIDGVSGDELVSAIHDLEPYPSSKSAKNEPAGSARSKGPGDIEMLTRAYLNLLRQPKRVFNLAARAGPAWLRLRKGREENQFTPLGPAQNTRFNRRVSGYLVMDAVIFELQDLKTIKNAFEKVTINDVMLAIVSGAMQRYLILHEETPERNLSAGMPINIRPMLDKPDYSDTSNLVTVAKVNLNNLTEDPLERLRAIHTSAMESKAYQNALGVDVMLEVSKSMPALLTSLASRAIPSLMTSVDPLVNTVVTNVPGSPVPLYMGGARLAGMCNMGIVLDGLGIFHAVSSYCGTATVAFQACRVAMPDPENYRICLQESFDAMLGAVKKASKSGSAKAPRRKRQARPKTAPKSRL
ncbi:MAG: wax ester/triacylglycerol synthase family O-acyltransferase [Pseudomonadales bacterium]